MKVPRDPELLRLALAEALAEIEKLKGVVRYDLAILRSYYCSNTDRIE